MVVNPASSSIVKSLAMKLAKQPYVTPISLYAQMHRTYNKSASVGSIVTDQQQSYLLGQIYKIT